MNMKKFNEKMARPKFSKGGYIKKIAGRKYFDTGGIAENASSPGVGGGNLTNTNSSGLGGISQALGLNAASANIQNGTNAAQLNNAYTGANNAINAQVGLTNTLTPGAQTGVNAQNQVENEALQEAAGAGPNPAQNELSQATGTNVANQAALMAGQRGASGNVGLAARNIGTQGAATQQGAAGEAATLEANQQIAEQKAAADIANNQIANAQGATTALNTAQQNEQNTLQNANTSANNSAVGMQSNINNVNAQGAQGILGGIGSAASALTGGLLAKGGVVSPHGKHKLEFVHKMTKMGLDHFDEGGGVGSDNSTSTTGSLANTASNFFSAGAPNSTADSTPSPSPTPTVRDPARADEGHTPEEAAHRAAVRKQYGYADGGQIASNPLLAGIANAPAPQVQTPGYNQSQASSGSNVQATPASTLDLGKSAKDGYDAGQKWAANRPSALMNKGLADAQTNFTNNLADGPSQTVADNGLGSDAYAMGGKIWNIHPSEHAKYSAEHFANYFSKGGQAEKVPAMVSPGEIYLPPDAVERVKHGADPLKEGMRVPGKAKVKGDSLKNDIVPADLDVGGVVIDRKHVGHPDKARLFVLKSLKATGKHMKKPAGMK